MYFLGENYGLFLEEENERGRWLEPSRVLNFYPFSSGVCFWKIFCKLCMEKQYCTVQGLLFYNNLKICV